MTSDELEPAAQVAAGFLAAWSGRDATAFAGPCDPGVHYEDPLTPAPLRGPAELGEHAAQLWEAFPDVRIEKADEPSAGPRALAVPCVLHGTHDAALGSLPATGRRLRLHGVFWAERGLDGRLLRVRAFFDLWDAGVQLGLLPARGGAGEKVLFLLRGFGLRATGR
jgi:SnoaL-like polyketide cyclase